MFYQQYLQTAMHYSAQYSFKILGTLAIIIIGKWLAGRLAALMAAVMKRSKIDTTLINFSRHLVYFLLLAIVAVAALGAMGIQTTSIVAALGAIGLAVGLALQGSLSNVGSAVLLMSFRPFKIGDTIEASGVTGTVEEVSLFSTTLKSADNKTIIVPNSKITSSNIINFSSKPSRRIEHIISIGYDDDLLAAKQIILEVLEQEELALQDPAPFVGVSALADSSVNLTVRVWTQNENYTKLSFLLLEKIKLAFDKQGITIPFPQMDLHINKKIANLQV
jgi:small conductance mechanosensitive channel